MNGEWYSRYEMTIRHMMNEPIQMRKPENSLIQQVMEKKKQQWNKVSQNIYNNNRKTKKMVKKQQTLRCTRTKLKNCANLLSSSSRITRYKKNENALSYMIKWKQKQRRIWMCMWACRWWTEANGKNIFHNIIYYICAIYI